MAGHSHASNVKHRKSARDAKKSTSFTKLVQRILSAARSSPNPDTNPALRVAIHVAQRASVPKSTIDNALDNLAKKADQEFDSVRYNISMGPIAFVVEALTENRNRTASNVRSTATKFGANMVETGSVEFMFDHVGAIVYQSSVCPEDEMLSCALDLGCSDFEASDPYYLLFTEKHLLHNICEELLLKYPQPVFVGLLWHPKVLLDIDEDSFGKASDLVDALEDLDDVQDVFVNFKKELSF